MNRATELAAYLLETGPERVCSACERESGKPPERLTAMSNKTHGTCKRHWIAQAQEAGMDPGWVSGKAEEYEREGKFAPDTGRQQQQAPQRQAPVPPEAPRVAPAPGTGGTGY